MRPSSTTSDPKFGPAAQTPAQRATVVAQLELATPGVITKASPSTRQLYGRYIAGELSWTQVRELRDLPPAALTDAATAERCPWY